LTLRDIKVRNLREASVDEFHQVSFYPYVEAEECISEIVSARRSLIRVRLTLSLKNCLAIFSISDIKSCGFPIP